jgi:hypothetical protein
MPAPAPGPATPLQSFLGGVGLALPAQALLSLNSRTFGISGFIHGAARGNLEDAMSVLGLVSGGFVVAAIEGTKPTIVNSAPLPLVLSGLLVGVGAKVRFQTLWEYCYLTFGGPPLRTDEQRLHVRVQTIFFL